MTTKNFLKDIGDALYLLERDNRMKSYIIYWNRTVKSSKEALIDVEIDGVVQNTFKISIEEVHSNEEKNESNSCNCI